MTNKHTLFYLKNCNAPSILYNSTIFYNLDLPDKQISLPTFVETNHCHIHHLNSTGKTITDRIVCVLGFACPDIIYSPGIYTLTALLLHYMNGLIL